MCWPHPWRAGPGHHRWAQLWSAKVPRRCAPATLLAVQGHVDFVGEPPAALMRAVDRLVGGGQALVCRRVLAELHGGRAQVDRHALQARGSQFEGLWDWGG